MRAKLMFLAVLPLLLITVGCATNPITGETQFMLFSEDQDVELGRSYAPEIEEQMGGRIQNLALQDYVNNVGQKVAAVSHKSYFDYQFTALDHESVNAFALPGGYIFITRGMLENLENEAQLASVLAHETVHVVARHSSNQISREIGFDIALSVAAKGTSGAAIQVAQITRQLVGLSYSRSQEKEADLGGLDYMVKAGYEPDEMVKTMRMLESKSQGETIEFFSTHPSPDNRVDYIAKTITERGYQNLDLKVGRQEYESFVLDELKQ